MKKISLALIILIIVGICIPAVSALDVYELPFNVEKSAQTYTSYTSEINHSSEYSTSSSTQKYIIIIDKMENYQNLHYIRLVIDRDLPGLEVGEHSILVRDPHNMANGWIDGYYICHKYTNILGQIVKTDVVVFIPNWDVNGLSGSYQSALYDTGGNKIAVGNYNQIFRPEWFSSSDDLNNKALFYIDRGELGTIKATSTVESYQDSRYALNVSIIDDTVTDNFKEVNTELIRVFDNKSTYSTIQMYNSELEILQGNQGLTDENFRVYLSELYKINVTANAFDDEYYFLLGQTPGDPTPDPSSATVIVYVKNSQTGALLANANLAILAATGGTETEIINQTLPSGIYNGPLQPTGGGMPNPDFYRLIPTAEGYNSIMPYIDFEVDGATTIYVYMDPIAGGPIDENNTFIDFFVRDMSANPISGATVNFGGYTLLTNSHGYTVFEVGKNATYTYTVSKSGYGPLTGNAVIGADARHTINTVLAPAVTPTTATPIPTSTSISPTPTLTAPTGEPVSNWLEWFAAHFGMILGGGVEIGKIFMWLCFTVPVGVYVGKEAKAGAAGFMAGAGIVTLFFVLIGWVPIWLVVLLVLIIGLLYAKVFNSQDNGGGR